MTSIEWKISERNALSREILIHFPDGSVPKGNLPIASALKKISRISSVRSTAIRTSTLTCFQEKRTPQSFRRANSENISNAHLFKVIDEEKTSLACKSSSPLYPDFVFSSFPDASPDVVKNFTVSLLTMPKMPDGASWGIANDFPLRASALQKTGARPLPGRNLSLLGLSSRSTKRKSFLALALLLGVLFHIYRSNSLVFQKNGRAERSHRSARPSRRSRNKLLEAPQPNGKARHPFPALAHVRARTHSLLCRP